MSEIIISRGNSKTAHMIAYMIQKDMKDKGLTTIGEWIKQVDDADQIICDLRALGLCLESGAQDEAYWIVDSSNDPPYCSACMTYALEDANGDFAMTNYCPECGAKMLGINREGIGCQMPMPSTSTGSTTTLKYEPLTD